VATRKVIDWLLEPDQPSVRYWTLKRLLGRPDSDSEVRAAQARIPEAGWAQEILAARQPGGWWVEGTDLYHPKYLSTNWMLQVLADLGLTKKDPRIAESCELWIARFARPDGGFGMGGGKRSHHCVAGNCARALIQMGYVDHPQVLSAMDWLVRTADKNGGWSCFGSGRNLDSWEGLSAFAVYPRDRWTAPMEECVRKAAEFFLQRELHRQGEKYAPWLRFHYPIHYYYDLLVGLDLLTALGYASDRRIEYALSILRKNRRNDGRWNLGGLHPDVEGGMAEWFAKHPRDRPTPFSLETVGKPSKMITLRALTVLERVAHAS
jgi:hypothetical protein